MLVRYVGAGVTRNENPGFFLQARSLLDVDYQLASAGYRASYLCYGLDLEITLKVTQYNER